MSHYFPQGENISINKITSELIFSSTQWLIKPLSETYILQLTFSYEYQVIEKGEFYWILWKFDWYSGYILYRVIHNDWKKVWASYSGQNTSCDMGEVYFFQWDPNILKLCFQQFQGGSCIFQIWKELWYSNL